MINGIRSKLTLSLKVSFWRNCDVASSGREAVKFRNKQVDKSVRPSSSLSD